MCECVIGDLWGPLLLCLALGMYVSVTTHAYIHSPVTQDITYKVHSLFARLLHAHSHISNSSEPAIHFVHVFVLVWGGAAVVTVNAQLLRGKVYA